MPQVDAVAFFSQVIWLMFLLAVLYIVFLHEVLYASTTTALVRNEVLTTNQIHHMLYAHKSKIQATKLLQLSDALIETNTVENNVLFTNLKSNWTAITTSDVEIEGINNNMSELWVALTKERELDE